MTTAGSERSRKMKKEAEKEGPGSPSEEQVPDGARSPDPHPRPQALGPRTAHREVHKEEEEAGR